jgi:hypothetical protein
MPHAGWRIWRAQSRFAAPLALALLALCAVLAGCGGGGLPQMAWPGHADEGIGMDYAAATAAMERLNYYRAISGVPPVELDYGLSRGCQLHADYLALNRIDLAIVGLQAHQEDQSAPGYTFSGELAAQNSVIFQGVGPVAAIDKWFQTLYHRLGLLDPNLQRIGLGTISGYQVLDVHQGRVLYTHAASASVIYPALGIGNVPGGFNREIPYPVAGDTSLGIPITVEFFGTLGRSILAVETQLLNTKTATTVPCYVQYPGHPLLEGWDYQQVIALIPEEPLTSGRYVVDISAFIDGQAWNMEWDFSVR